MRLKIISISARITTNFQSVFSGSITGYKLLTKNVGQFQQRTDEETTRD